MTKPIERDKNVLDSEDIFSFSTGKRDRIRTKKEIKSNHREKRQALIPSLFDKSFPHPRKSDRIFRLLLWKKQKVCLPSLCKTTNLVKIGKFHPKLLQFLPIIGKIKVQRTEDSKIGKEKQ
jgi:hypothetical protein